MLNSSGLQGQLTILLKLLYELFSDNAHANFRVSETNTFTVRLHLTSTIVSDTLKTLFCLIAKPVQVSAKSA